MAPLLTYSIILKVCASHVASWLTSMTQNPDQLDLHSNLLKVLCGIRYLKWLQFNLSFALIILGYSEIAERYSGVLKGKEKRSKTFVTFLF